MNKYNQKWVSWLFRKESWCITLFGTSFFSVSENQVSIYWYRHEDCHKRQQEDEPFLFYPKYLFFMATKGYKNNPYEVEARLSERRNE